MLLKFWKEQAGLQESKHIDCLSEDEIDKIWSYLARAENEWLVKTEVCYIQKE